MRSFGYPDATCGSYPYSLRLSRCSAFANISRLVFIHTKYRQVPSRLLVSSGTRYQTPRGETVSCLAAELEATNAKESHLPRQGSSPCRCAPTPHLSVLDRTRRREAQVQWVLPGAHRRATPRLLTRASAFRRLQHQTGYFASVAFPGKFARAVEEDSTVVACGFNR